MMKLSEIRGERALDMLAELMEPAAEILGDEEIRDAWRSDGKGSRLKAVKIAISNHKSAVIAVMAALEEKDPEEYANEVGVFTLPVNLLRLLNDPEMTSLFSGQGRTSSVKGSGSATESIKGKGK